MKFSKILPRQQLVPQVDTVYDLLQSTEGWTQLREQRHFKIPKPTFLGDFMGQIASIHRYKRNYFRVPQICLSKYKNATILPHQFIMLENGLITGDSIEEPVNINDGVWYDKNNAVNTNGQDLCFPRITYHEAWIEKNIVNIDKYLNVPEVHIKEPVYSICSWYHQNICHWMIDLLPRLWALKYFPGKKPKILLPAPSMPFIRESLQLLGFTSEDIITVHNAARYKIDTLYCPSRVASQYNFFSPEIVEFYNELKGYAQNYTPGEHEKIYISRQDTSERPCKNELELENELIKRGFKIIQLANINFQDRVSLFNGCRVLVGACGAGMTHALLMQNKTDVIIMATPEMHQNSTMFCNLAAQKEQNISLIGGYNMEHKQRNKDAWQLDITDTLDQIDYVVQC